MKVLIAIDSFKDSLTYIQAGETVREGIKRVYADAQIHISPVADGGEGTVEALVKGLGGKKEKVMVTGPLGKKIDSEYGIINNTAILEMSAAAGI